MERYFSMLHVVSFIIARPVDSYDNTHRKGYEERGGQDILLMKLTKKSSMKPACLPGLNFQDTEVQSYLAGYGKYFRSSCQTSSKGPMKYHYCMTDPDCIETKNCPPKFNDGTKDYVGCQMKAKTPAKWSRRCSKFLHQSGYKFGSEVDEVHLLQLSKTGEGKFLETCYRQEAGHLGWCRTDGNFYQSDKKEKETRISRSPEGVLTYP